MMSAAVKCYSFFSVKLARNIFSFVFLSVLPSMMIFT